MSSRTDNSMEVEPERQRRIEEMTSEHGPKWADEYRPGSFGCHELLDRAALAADDIESRILSHPACIQNQDWYELAEQAAAILRELYQRIGADHL